MSKTDPLITDLTLQNGSEFPPTTQYVVVQDLKSGYLKICYVYGDYSQSFVMEARQAEQHANQILEIVKAKRERVKTTS